MGEAVGGEGDWRIVGEAWFARQHIAVKALSALFTAAFVVITLWLFGAVGLVAGWAGIDWAWLKSPIGIGS